MDSAANFLQELNFTDEQISGMDSDDLASRLQQRRGPQAA